MVIANTPLVKYYDMLIDTPVAVQVGALKIDHRGFIPEFSVFATNPWE